MDDTHILIADLARSDQSSTFRDMVNDQLTHIVLLVAPLRESHPAMC